MGDRDGDAEDGEVGGADGDGAGGEGEGDVAVGVGGPNRKLVRARQAPGDLVTVQGLFRPDRRPAAVLAGGHRAARGQWGRGRALGGRQRRRARHAG